MASFTQPPIEFLAHLAQAAAAEDMDDLRRKMSTWNQDSSSTRPRWDEPLSILSCGRPNHTQITLSARMLGLLCDAAARTLQLVTGSGIPKLLLLVRAAAVLSSCPFSS
jgi:hypothetical protein